MTLTCPHCGFAREIDEARIPAQAARVTCPRCRQSFPLARQEAPLPEPSAAPLPPAAGGEGATWAEAVPKAGFWIRVVAWMVDSVIVTVTQLVLGLILGLTAAGLGGGLDPGGQAAMAMVTWLFGTALTVAYYVFFTGYCGQTPGKMALRIKVIRTDGTELGYGRAALREVLGKFVSGILLGIGYLMVAFDDQKQGLHDRMADTYVIKL